MRARNVSLVLILALGLLAAPLALAASNGRGKDRQQETTTTATANGATALDAGTATLVVLVNATGADGAFTLTTEGGDALPASFTLSTREGTARIAFGGLQPNHTYALRQTVPEGWNLTRATCDDGTTPAAVRIPANGTLTCGFDNERLGTLLVRVLASGADLALPFTVTNATYASLPAAFNVTTTNGTGQRAFTVQPLANLSLLPGVPAGWNLTRASCAEGLAPGNVSVGRNQTLACTFEVERLNTLVVKLATRGGDLALPVNATGPGLPAQFNLTTLGGVATLAFADLETDRSYALAPQVPAGWKLSGSHCDAGTLADVHLAAGRTATCQLNLTRLATLTVVILARGGDATFTLTGAGPSLPATLHVATVNGTGLLTHAHALDPDATHALGLALPGGWRLAGSACTTGTPANLTLAPGGAATCTFEATRLAEIRGTAWMDRDRDGARDANEEGIQGWTLWIDADADGTLDTGERVATTGADGRYAFPDLAPGAYLVRELVPAGWVATTSTHHAVSLGDGAVAANVDFGALQPSATNPPPTQGGDHGGSPGKGNGGKGNGNGKGGPAGTGYWRNWDNHHARAHVDAWVRNASNASAWLMPTGYATTADGAERLFEDATKQCNRTFGHHGCAQKKLEAHLLALRLNLASGRLDPTANANLNAGSDAAAYLGLPPNATVQQLLDAIDAKAGTKPTRDQLQTMRAALERVNGS